MTKRTRMLTSFALAAMIPSMCFAENAAAEAEATAVGAAEAGDTAVATGDAAERKRAPASNFLNIVRGRFPLLLVHACRFDEALGKMSTKDLAAKMATSVGKIFDIRKGRNFAYLTKDFKPSASDVSEAKAWAGQIGQQNAKGLQATGDATLILKIVEQYEKAGLATAEETAKFTASKPKSNFGAKTASAPAASTAAAAGAGEKTVASKAGSADDLLG